MDKNELASTIKKIVEDCVKQQKSNRRHSLLLARMAAEAIIRYKFIDFSNKTISKRSISIGDLLNNKKFQFLKDQFSSVEHVGLDYIHGIVGEYLHFTMPFAKEPGEKETKKVIQEVKDLFEEHIPDFKIHIHNRPKSEDSIRKREDYRKLLAFYSNLDSDTYKTDRKWKSFIDNKIIIKNKYFEKNQPKQYDITKFVNMDKHWKTLLDIELKKWNEKRECLLTIERLTEQLQIYEERINNLSGIDNPGVEEQLHQFVDGINNLLKLHPDSINERETSLNKQILMRFYVKSTQKYSLQPDKYELTMTDLIDCMERSECLCGDEILTFNEESSLIRKSGQNFTLNGEWKFMQY